MAYEIDREVKSIITACYERGREIIEKRRDILDRCVELLMEKERISREEFEGLYNAIYTKNYKKNYYLCTIFSNIGKYIA
jgi:cell division protease FtsH